jgi:hypothetical protein
VEFREDLWGENRREIGSEVNVESNSKSKSKSKTPPLVNRRLGHPVAVVVVREELFGCVARGYRKAGEILHPRSRVQDDDASGVVRDLKKRKSTGKIARATMRWAREAPPFDRARRDSDFLHLRLKRLAVERLLR